MSRLIDHGEEAHSLHAVPADLRQKFLAAKEARDQQRNLWILRLAVTAVLIGAAIYARWLWPRL